MAAQRQVAQQGQTLLRCRWFNRGKQHRKNKRMLSRPPVITSANNSVLLSVFSDIVNEFHGAVRDEDSLLPDDTEFTADLGTDRNLDKIPRIGRQL